MGGGWGGLISKAGEQASPLLQAFILGCAVLTGIFVSGVLLVIAGVQPRALFDEVVVETLLDPELSLGVVSSGPLDLCRLGRGGRLSRPLLEFWHRGPDDLGAIGATLVSR